MRKYQLQYKDEGMIRSGLGAVIPRMRSLLFLMVAVFALYSCNNHQEDHQTAGNEKYTCPMHPQIINEGPGSCPICKMDLVKVQIGTKDRKLVLSPEQIRLAGIKTIFVQPGEFSASKVVNARIVSNEEATVIIPSRFDGRIDKLFIRETGVQVSKGQALYQIYSEELQALQQDLILQAKQLKAFPEEKIYLRLRDAARNKLRLYGYSDKEIKQIEEAKSLSSTITVYAPASGIVRELNVIEGDYVNAGTDVMRLEDLTTLWVEADYYPSEGSLLKQGTPVEVSVEGGRPVKAAINFVSPVLEASTQLVRARINIQNNGSYQPGMFATVSLPYAQKQQVVMLPVDAVLRDENKAVAWIKTAENTFEPREIRLGDEDENSVVILSGLENAKEVVTAGTYLLSSELSLKYPE